VEYKPFNYISVEHFKLFSEYASYSVLVGS